MGSDSSGIALNGLIEKAIDLNTKRGEINRNPLKQNSSVNSNNNAMGGGK